MITVRPSYLFRFIRQNNKTGTYVLKTYVNQTS